MQKNKLNIRLKKKEYLGHRLYEIIGFIKQNKRVLLDANPATGKTRLFANLAIKLKQGNLKGRIVFLTPFLIIQDQLESYLKKSGFGIDFILNHTVTNKVLKNEYTIISSTYHSFHHISDELTEDDYVIVDEAHALLYNYHENKYKKFYFDSTIAKLYSTCAKLVLMTGTPLSGINKILGLHTIKVTKKKALKSTINVCFSMAKVFDIAISFAQRVIYSDDFDETQLNIIYVKDRAQCERIAFAINNIYNKNAKVLTSKHKSEQYYKEIVQDMTVPKDIQFLVTTNVISTGANIMNDNIGKALMINEYSPLEIKQFSKRFRSKLDLEVDIINSFNPNQITNEDLYSPNTIKEERTKQRRYFKSALKSLNKIKDTENNFDDFKYSFEPDYKGTPQHLIDIIIERFTKQESYFNDLLISCNYFPDDIVKGLSKYDDIKPFEDDSLHDYDNTDTETISDSIDEILTKDKNKIVNSIIANEDSYLKAIKDSLVSSDKIYSYRFDTYIKKDLRNTTYTSEISDIVNTSGFKTTFFNNMLKHIQYLESAPKSLYFDNNVPDNKQNKHLVAVKTSQVLHKYFDIKYLTATMGATLKLKDTVSIKDLQIELVYLINIIQEIHKYLLGKIYFHYSDLRLHLYSTSNLKSFKNHKQDFVCFPLNLCKKKSKTNSLSKDLLIGIVKGVFLLKSTPANRNDKSGKSSKAYFFESAIPDKYNVTSKTLDTDYNLITSKTVLMPDLNIKELKTKMDIKSSHKVISNSTLLNYIELGANFYKLTK